MSRRDNGGPAFPSLAELDLRDYFAAKALQGILARMPWLDLTAERLAEICYERADAMLKVRRQ